MLQLLLERGQSYADLASLLGTRRGRGADPRPRRADRAGRRRPRPQRRPHRLSARTGRPDRQGRRRPPPEGRPGRPRARHRAHPEASSGGSAGRAPAPAGRGVAAPAPPRRRALPAAGSRFPIACGESERRSSRPRALRAPSRAPRGPRTTLSRRQTQLLVALGSGAVLVVAVVLAVTGAFSSGSDDSAPSTTTSTTPTGASAGPQGFPVTDIKVPKLRQATTTPSDPEGVPDAPAPDAGRLPDPGREEGGRQGDQDRPSTAGSRSFR